MFDRKKETKNNHDEEKKVQEEINENAQAEACEACGDEPIEAVSCDLPEVEAESASGEEPTQAQWREALELAVKQRDEYLAIAQRAQADFANFKRRNATVRTDAYDDGVRESLAALLPVLDTFDRAMASITEVDDQWAEGVRMTMRQMTDVMAKLGLEEIPSLGEMFDPELHNAVMREAGEVPGTVLDVFEKGYRARGRIIRYAMVKVAAE